MRFKTRKEPVNVSDIYYDLFEGGYIVPSKLLSDKEDIAKVNAALDIIRTFLTEAEEVGVIEIN